MSSELPFLHRVNAFLTHAWARGWWPEPTLDATELEAEACRREGVGAVLGDRWREPFRLLLADLHEHARLNPLGRQSANGQLVGLLRARIRAERLLRRQPAVLNRSIRSPVIILGPMRSGTTRMHRLLASDPRFAHTRLFEALEPVPFGRRFDRRLAQAAAVQALLTRVNPALVSIHPTSPLQAEEEFGLHSFSFHGAQFEVQWNVPRFAQWAETADTRPAYREFRILLQIMGWSRGERADKPWLLKSPQFTADPESLLEAFPDARLICLHRDWAEVVASSASLVWNQRRVHSDAADKAAIGAEWLAKTALRARRTAAFRAAHPNVRQIDISYEETNRDWDGTIARVYRFLGLDLPGATLTRMRRLMAGARHQGHRYSIEEFGLEPDRVAEAFAPLPCRMG